MSMLVVKTRSAFGWQIPTQIIFGAGVAGQAPDQAKKLGISKVLVVTDKGVANTEGCKALVEGLKAGGVNPTVWSEVQADPPDTTIGEGVKVYLDGKFDGLIAIGGGSSMDTAKGIGLVALNGHRINDYDFNNPNPPPITKMPPLIAIPTTAGTASEISAGAVISDTSKDVKFFVWNYTISAKLALLDPNLTLSLPANQTAATGMDAFTHAADGYIGIMENPVSDALALYAVELISQNLRRAVYNGSDIGARTNMLLASLMAGLSFSNSFPGCSHAIGHTLGAKYHIPHGLACAVAYPACLEYTRPAREEKMAMLAQAVGIKTEGMSDTEAAQAFIQATAQLMRDIGIPSLAEATGMTEADVESVAKVAVTDGCAPPIPRPFTVESCVEVLKKALAVS